MNLLHSDNTYEELIQHMERCGYSPYHIQRVKREMKWLQIASLNGHLCHIRRTARDIISGQERTH